MQLKISSPKIWLATQAVDFRYAIQGLCQLIETQFAMNVREGIYIFYSKDRKKLKLLTWHKNGFVLIYKRLERGCFTLQKSEEGLLTVDEKQLSWLLAGFDWVSMSLFKELEFDDYF